MAITLNITLPDRLKIIFDEQAFHKIAQGRGPAARNALLTWLWSKGGIWVTSRPRVARDALEQLVTLHLDRITFMHPRELGHEDWPNAVIEMDDSMLDITLWMNQSVIGQTRVLEYGKGELKKTAVDKLGLSFDDRVAVLKEVRAGSNTNYDEHDLIASITRESFYHFVREFWSEIIPDAFVDNWHIPYLCEELQSCVLTVIDELEETYNLLINISPTSTKSTLVSIMLPAWTWTRMACARYIGASYAHPLAMDLSRKNRIVVQSTKYKECFNIKLTKDQNAKSYFVNEDDGMRMGVGTGGIAGFHAHFIGIDDPLDPNKRASDTEVAAANQWIFESLMQRKVDQARTPVILIMQRLCQGDPSDLFLEKLGDSVKHICLPSEKTDDIKPMELAEKYIDGVMDNNRMPAKVLEEKRKTVGDYVYAGQFLQRPTMPEGGMFKVGMIQLEPVPRAAFKAIWRYWDKAGTKAAGCWTVGLKLGLDIHDRFWILDVVRGQWEADEREAIIKLTAQNDRQKVKIGVEQEPGSSGKDVARFTVKNLAGFFVYVDPPSGDKPTRAYPASVQVNNGNVSMIEAPWNAELVNEMTFFPFSKFKDQVDALSGGFKMLTNQNVVGGAPRSKK